jgi:predicted metal-binding membrane protein
VSVELGGATRARPLGILPVAGVLVGLALVAWVVTIERMDGMDAGPGTDLGTFGWFLGLWVTMMAAMMFPAAAPMAAVVARVSASPAPGTSRAIGSTATFIAGYLVVWTAFGVVAYAAYRAIDAAGPGALAWDAQGPLIAGGAIVAAGAYQLTPLKRACLRHCRSPVAFVMHRWRSGALGAFVMGIEHGAWCLGCCAGLMLVLLVLGVMSLVWMALIAAAIFIEKVLPIGERASRAFAVALIGLGIWMAAAPGSVPFLGDPGMQMDMDESPARGGMPGTMTPDAPPMDGAMP